MRVTQHRCKMRSSVFFLKFISFHIDFNEVQFLSTNSPISMSRICDDDGDKELSKFTYELNTKVIDRQLFALYKCELYFESPLLHNHPVNVLFLD